MPHANRMSHSLHVNKRQLVASVNEQSLLSVVVDGLQQGFWSTHYILFIVSDCCLTPNEQFCRYMMARTSYIRYHEMMSTLYKTNTLNSWIFIVLAHWNNNSLVDMSFYLDILSLFQANQSLFFFLNAATNTNVLSLCFNLKILSRFTRLFNKIN